MIGKSVYVCIDDFRTFEKAKIIGYDSLHIHDYSFRVQVRDSIYTVTLSQMVLNFELYNERSMTDRALVFSKNGKEFSEAYTDKLKTIKNHEITLTYIFSHTETKYMVNLKNLYTKVDFFSLYGIIYTLIFFMFTINN